MSGKTKTISLETYEVIDSEKKSPPYDMKRVWKVRRVTDSIEYTPGQGLDKATVDSLCASSAWKVTITEPAQ
jgi:hypothetical protein